jgi:hypothetical protein
MKRRFTSALLSLAVAAFSITIGPYGEVIRVWYAVPLYYVPY